MFEILQQAGLTDFYGIDQASGVRVESPPPAEAFRFLDDPGVRDRFVDFQDDRTTRCRFRIPSIHCIGCVWLLENLFRLRPEITSSRVDLSTRELCVAMETSKLALSDVAALLASLGYEPELRLSDVESAGSRRAPSRRLWLQLGVAGFAFGNLMLFSLAGYFGLDEFHGPAFRRLTGWLGIAVSIPVVVFSAADYWKAAWRSLRHRTLTIDVPIAAGIAAFFLQSVHAILTGRGDGYLDSLAGLLFFLLIGRLYQHKTFEFLSFDRDYKSFFPLSATRLRGGVRESAGLSQLAVGDTLLIRHGELIPGDARLVRGEGLIDYSFVTGESTPTRIRADKTLYAGGRQVGGAIEVELAKPVSQSYLASLWNHAAFRKDKTASMALMTDLYGRRLTKLVLAVALGAAGYWWVVQPEIALQAFASVLIVACPCALALAAPFATGTASRVLARKGVFLKSPQIMEALARVDSVVFDKTGTLTSGGAGAVEYNGRALTPAEQGWVAAVAANSTHPLARRLAECFAGVGTALPVEDFAETQGGGMEARVDGHVVRLGSARWMASLGVALPDSTSKSPDGAVVVAAIDGEHRGVFRFRSSLRPAMRPVLAALSGGFRLALLSGDNDAERDQFAGLFGRGATLRFNQSPMDKLECIRQLQGTGRVVMMVGDGLNDAGAFQQSDVGVAVVDRIGSFSPASDVIVTADVLDRLPGLLGFARATARVVRVSFALSAVYNAVGIAIAARGLLSPVICAVLMPLSSATVVAFATGVTGWMARRWLDGSGRVRPLEAGGPAVEVKEALA